MLRNYLLVAWRNLWRQKGYSALNIVGLALGIAAGGPTSTRAVSLDRGRSGITGHRVGSPPQPSPGVLHMSNKYEILRSRRLN